LSCAAVYAPSFNPLLVAGVAAGAGAGCAAGAGATAGCAVSAGAFVPHAARLRTSATTSVNVISFFMLIDISPLFFISVIMIHYC
jgi:hypothetical protein